MKEKLASLLIGVFLGLILIYSLKSCEKKPDVTKTVTRKIGKTVLSSTKENVSFDTLHWIATYKANTKPIIKWKKPKNDTVLIESNPSFSPCDSIFASLDSGSIQGVKFAIVDTISDNRVIGRSIKLEVPQLTISKNTINTNDSLRVDTVYINSKQKFGTNAKWFLRGCAACGVPAFAVGVFVPK